MSPIHLRIRWYFCFGFLICYICYIYLFLSVSAFWYVISVTSICLYLFLSVSAFWSVISVTSICWKMDEVFCFDAHLSRTPDLPSFYPQTSRPQSAFCTSISEEEIIVFCWPICVIFFCCWLDIQWSTYFHRHCFLLHCLIKPGTGQSFFLAALFLQESIIFLPSQTQIKREVLFNLGEIKWF